MGDPEQCEETEEGTLAADWILSIEGGELAREHQIPEAYPRLLPAAFLLFSLQSLAQNLADLRVVGSEDVATFAVRFLEAHLDAVAFAMMSAILLCCRRCILLRRHVGAR